VSDFEKDERNAVGPFISLLRGQGEAQGKGGGDDQKRVTLGVLWEEGRAEWGKDNVEGL